MSRIQNAKRNILAGALYKIVEIGTPFITRTILLYYLGVEYLGLGTLFSSILQVLNLAELGFSRAIIFSLFKPLNEKDEQAVNALLNFYRKIYLIVGSVIMIGGIIILPILPKLIKDEYPQDINLYILFIIYLINTSVSYWLFAYKNALITAAQRQDVISNIRTLLGIVKFGAQIIVLMVFKNYYAFILLNIFFTIVNNILVSAASRKLFPQYKSRGNIDSETKDTLIRQIKGIAIGKFSQAARNSFDSIVLSMFCGLVELAIYSNYFYIVTSVTGILGIIIEAISSGVGDSIATESHEKNYLDFKKFNFFYAWISCWFTICLFCLYQTFMELWVGSELCAPFFSVILFTLYFYELHIGQMRAVYATSAGIWWEFRWISIGEMICNICLNFWLGWKYGMNGILWATIITVFIFSFLGITIVTFKKYFERSPKEYFLSEFIYSISTLITLFATYYTTQMVQIDGILGLILKGLLCIFVPNILFRVLCCFSKTYSAYYKEMISFVKGSFIR